MKTMLLLAISFIGVTTFILSVGGVILILMGTKILIEHLELLDRLPF